MVIDITAGYRFTCALIEISQSIQTKGNVKCWGMNLEGQLGYGDVEYRGSRPKDMGKNLAKVDLGTDFHVDLIEAGTDHVCARISQTKRIKCWGKNANGELGLGDVNNRGDEPEEMGDKLDFVDLGKNRTVTSMSSGSRHTCAVLDDSSVKCFGGNDLGQLGLGDVNNRGDQVGEMGEKLLPVSLGTVGLPVVKVHCGYWHSCALFSNSKIKCFGDGEFGRLGYVRFPRIGDEPGEMGDSLPFVDLGTSRLVLSVNAGAFHTCAFLDNQTVKCFGSNFYGQLGIGDTESRGDDPNEMGNNLLPVNFGTTTSFIPSSNIALMDFATCVLMQNDKGVKCFGANEEGQLGLGDSANRGDGPDEMGDNLPIAKLGNNKISKIVSGAKHVCALFKNKRIKCWGFNYDGQLGLGNTKNYGKTKSRMGRALPYVKL